MYCLRSMDSFNLIRWKDKFSFKIYSRNSITGNVEMIFIVKREMIKLQLFIWMWSISMISMKVAGECGGTMGWSVCSAFIGRQYPSAGRAPLINHCMRGHIHGWRNTKTRKKTVLTIISYNLYPSFSKDCHESVDYSVHCCIVEVCDCHNSPNYLLLCITI